MHSACVCIIKCWAFCPNKLIETLLVDRNKDITLKENTLL